jgi:hypothetical protein
MADAHERAMVSKIQAQTVFPLLKFHFTRNALGEEGSQTEARDTISTLSGGAMMQALPRQGDRTLISFRCQIALQQFFF